MPRRIRIGVDTGGTFTDVVAFDEDSGQVVTTKTPSTPADPAQGFMDGIHHTWAQQIVGDALRQNAVSLGDARVLRLPLLGLRVAPDDFFAQIEAALVAAGWSAVPGRPA